MKSDVEAESIQSLMKAVRDKRSKRVFDLQTEAHRFVDWKEYVRTAPIISLIGSSAAGFLVVNGLRNSLPPATLPRENLAPTQANVATASKMQWLVSLAMPILTNTAKKYIAQTLSSILQGTSNESQPVTQTLPQRGSYTE